MSEPSLDEVLADDYVVEETTETEAAKGVVEAETPDVETPLVEAEAKDEPPSSEPQEKRIDPDQFKGYLDEREKRQKLEAEIEEMQKRLDSKPAEPQQRIDPIDDPEGFQAQVDQRIRESEFKNDLKWMKRTHDDWDAAETWINEGLGTNVAMQAKLTNSENLLEDAYKMYQDHIKLQELSNVDELRAKLREEVKAELMGEISKESGDKEISDGVKSAAVNKPSLANTGNSTGSVATEGMLSLDDVLGRDFNNRPRS